MAADPNRALLDDALSCFQRGAVRFVDGKMKAKDGTDWFERWVADAMRRNVINRNSSPTLDDPAILLNVMAFCFDDIFGRPRKHLLSKVYELKESRNRLVHHESPVEPKDVYMAVQHVLEILRAISASKATVEDAEKIENRVRQMLVVQGFSNSSSVQKVKELERKLQVVSSQADRMRTDRVSKDEAFRRLKASGHPEESKYLELWRDSNGNNWGWDGHMRGTYPELVSTIWPSVAK